MILYRIEYDESVGLECVTKQAWEGTQADARKKQKALEAEHGRTNVVDFEQVDVPTSKAELLAWLNENAANV